MRGRGGGVKGQGGVWVGEGRDWNTDPLFCPPHVTLMQRPVPDASALNCQLIQRHPVAFEYTGGSNVHPCARQETER